MYRFFNILLSLAFCMSLHAELLTYPAGKGVSTIEDFTVMVSEDGNSWNNVALYPVKVDEVRDAKHNVEIASMGYFDFNGKVYVKVISNNKTVETSRIRPLSYGITPDVSGDTLTFALDRPRNLSIEINGDIFHNLHLFANPIDKNRPTPKVLKNLKKHKDLIYFGPGRHELAGGVMRIPSGKTVYVDGGARVVGQLVADSVRDVRFYGRGEIHPEGSGEGIYIRNSRNVEADGVIVTQIPVGGSDSVRISNVKSISSYGWGDGMNVFASNDVSYDGVFCRNSDDCTTVYATRKGFVGGCRNIRMENSTLWADVAHPVMIGLHGSATEIGVDAPSDTICNLTYRNIDILDHCEKQIDYQGCLAISCGDNNIVRDIVFDNIRVEDFRQGQLVNIRIFFNDKYCKAPGRSVDNVLFKDITYNGNPSHMSVICGYDSGRMVNGVTFENLVINGERISDDMPGKPKWYKTGDMCGFYIGNHVKNITFK